VPHPHPRNTPSVVIVAHTRRAAWANELQAHTGATKICLDDGTLGCYRNHLAAWEYHRANSFHGWAVVIEDDAIPVPDFPAQLDLALSSAPPAISIAALYLGRARPPQYQIPVAAAVADAVNDNHAWIVTTKALSAVGIAVRTELVASLCAHLYRAELLDIDEAITQWAGLKHMIGYTMPSLLDHRDTETLAAHRDGQPRTPGRVAYKHGSRDNWRTPVTVMVLP
jgi:hypothetical protein